MIKLIRRAAAVVVLPVVAVGAVATVSATAAQASSPTSAAQVVNLTNGERVKHGCPKLRVNAALTRAATLHSQDMAAHGYFSHVSRSGATFIQRAKSAGYNYAIGENIAWGYRTPGAVMDGWMKSPGHRANILNCRAQSIGVGVATNNKGVPYWTQVFGKV